MTMDNRHEIEELEQLMRETFRNEATPPPADAWQRVQAGLKPKPTAAAKWLVAGGLLAAAAAIVAAVALMLPGRPDTAAQLAAAPQAAPVVEASTPAALADDAPAQPLANNPVAANDNASFDTLCDTYYCDFGPLPDEKPATRETAREATRESTSETTLRVDTQAPQTAAAPVPAAATKSSPAPAEGTPLRPAAPASQTDSNPSVSVASQPDVDNTKGKNKNDINLVIPTLLTPNGDGYNDCWIIEGLDRYNHVEVTIYTARSQRVYSSTDYHNDFCGDHLPVGNYFYVVVIRDQQYVTRGVLIVK